MVTINRSLPCPEQPDTPVDPTDPVYSIPVLLGCDEVLTSTSAILQALDDNPAPGRLYQFYLNGGPAGVPQAERQRSVEGLPDNGSEIVKRIEYSDDGGGTFLLGDVCTCTAWARPSDPDPDPVIIDPSINDCDRTMVGPQDNFTWSDPDKTSDTIYDFWLGTSAGARDVYDHVGNNVFADQFVTVSNLPTNGTTLYATLRVFRNGPGSDPIIVTCQFTAAFIESPFEGIDRTGMAELNITPVARGSFDAFDWQNIWGSAGLDTWFTQNAGEIAATNVGGELALEVAHIPTGDGSARVLSAGRTGGNPTVATLVQRVYYPDNFDFGSNSSATLKAGFGIRSDVDASGGSAKPNGFTSRFGTRRSGGVDYHSVYAYSALTTGFGDDYITDCPVETGVWTEIAQELVMNSAYGVADGSLRIFIDGELKRTVTGIMWQRTRGPNDPTFPSIEGFSFASFHGGSSSTTWAPDTTQFPAYTDICFKFSRLAA